MEWNQYICSVSHFLSIFTFQMKAKFPKTKYLTIIDSDLDLKHKEELQQVKDTISSLEHEKDDMEKEVCYVK